MSKNPKGELQVKANGQPYRLHLGMSVLADLQEQFGDDLENILAIPEDGKLPNLKAVHALFLAALQRHHSDTADRWLVDDILAENQNVLASLLTASFPDAVEGGSEGEGKKKAAA